MLTPPVPSERRARVVSALSPLFLALLALLVGVASARSMPAPGSRGLLVRGAEDAARSPPAGRWTAPRRGRCG